MIVETFSKAVTMLLNMVPLLGIVLLNLLTGQVVGASNEDYPLNLREKSYLEKLSRRTFTARIDDAPDHTEPAEMLKILNEESKRLHKIANKDEESERSLVLIEHYRDFGEVKLERCDAEWLQDLLFTVKNHQDSDKSALPRYLRDCVFRQFDLCQKLWDDRFFEAISTVSLEIRDSMDLLLKYLMEPNLDDSIKPRFYTREDLKAVIDQHEAHSLLVFLSQLGKLKGIADKNLKSTGDVSYEQFNKIYDEAIIDSLCSIVCVELQPATNIYKLAYRSDIMSYRKQDGRPVQTSDFLLEWLANKMICCDLKADQKLKKAAYEELIGVKKRL